MSVRVFPQLQIVYVNNVVAGEANAFLTISIEYVLISR